MKVPPELVQQWWEEIVDARSEHWPTDVASKAAQWAADQELNAVMAELKALNLPEGYANRLRAARRPKPPSLAERALEQYERVEDILLNHDVIPAGCIRTALNRLAELEAQQ